VFDSDIVANTAAVAPPQKFTGGTPVLPNKRPAGCAVSRVLFRRSLGKLRQRRPFIWTRLCRRALSLAGEAAYPRSYWPEPGRDRCLALHPMGFAMPVASRRPRCALTAPFHPYPGRKGRGGLLFCGTFPTPPASRRGGGRYPPSRFSGARTFLPPCKHEERPSTHPAPPLYDIRARMNTAQRGGQFIADGLLTFVSFGR